MYQVCFNSLCIKCHGFHLHNKVSTVCLFAVHLMPCTCTIEYQTILSESFCVVMNSVLCLNSGFDTLCLCTTQCAMDSTPCIFVQQNVRHLCRIHSVYVVIESFNLWKEQTRYVSRQTRHHSNGLEMCFEHFQNYLLKFSKKEQFAKRNTCLCVNSTCFKIAFFNGNFSQHK